LSTTSYSQRDDGFRPWGVDDTGQPFVSVIVPTYNRAALLPSLFLALQSQVYRADHLELIVVDNSSDDDTVAVVERWAAALPFPVTFRRKENRGPAASRNLGASLARGDVLAFVDSDCIPEPSWIYSAVRAFTPDVDIVCGSMIGLSSSEPGMFGVQLKESLTDTGLYPSGNLFFRRECFEAASGFDERFGIYPWGGLVAGEDTDLVWRAKRSGANAVFVSDVVVGHQPTRPPALVPLLLEPVILQIFPRLLRTVPELRQTYLWHRYFMSAQQFRFDAALGGAIVAARTRRAWPLLAAIPWLLSIRHAVRLEWRRGGALAAARCFALLVQQFTTGTTVLMAASVRYRRVVL
jgi:glycosyltransferase involved in cell wall biosynthesis